MRKNTSTSEIAATLSACRGAFVGIGIFSGFINVLALSGSLFMMEVYDRVIPSGSLPTLAGLFVLVAILYFFQGALELMRTRLLGRIGASLDQALRSRVFDAVIGLQLRAPRVGESSQPLRDLDTIRAFLSGSGPTAFFDMPWLPFYLGICFIFHQLLGLAVLFGVVFLIFLTILTELISRLPTQETARQSVARNRMLEMSRRNAEALVAMGMAGRVRQRWQEVSDRHLQAQQSTSDTSGGFGGMGRVFRMLLQSGVLAVGAYLVIGQEATSGVILAGSILSARALAPIDLAISNWKGFSAARQAKERLDKLLVLLPEQREPMQLPKPQFEVAVQNIAAAPPEAQKIVVQDISFVLKPGSGLGVIGPSASGKSSLARLLVGIWTPQRGTITIDGAPLNQWSAEALGTHIGYLPQNVELLEGTVAENISRFDSAATPDQIIAAAKAASIHDLVLGLPQGYDTQIGEQGENLSSGQRQRLALARALFGDPFLVVLDEPNSNLDAEGEAALTKAMLAVRQRQGIVIVIAHRPSALAGVDFVLAMAGGRQQAFGPKDEVLAKVLQSASGLKVVPTSAVAS
ncbi:type I secretion system permease/ATPase [Rhizobium terrae]|uniref:type I secretion system permease/ATPase n=1 Tax=Rhizobium terrae TaxID=2171756 RepID=UPI000E3C89C5|nr:type I secretion system permease/ATPase [Rhizobium terrae]